jgi:hypothetical protein
MRILVQPVSGNHVRTNGHDPIVESRRSQLTAEVIVELQIVIADDQIRAVG